MVKLQFRPEVHLRSWFRRGEELACFVQGGAQPAERGPGRRGPGAPWSLPKAIVGFRNLGKLTPGPHAIAGWAGVV